MFNRRRDEEGEVKTEELELDRVGMEDNDISQVGNSRVQLWCNGTTDIADLDKNIKCSTL